MERRATNYSSMIMILQRYKCKCPFDDGVMACNNGNWNKIRRLKNPKINALNYAQLYKRLWISVTHSTEKNKFQYRSSTRYLFLFLPPTHTYIFMALERVSFYPIESSACTKSADFSLSWPEFSCT